MKVSKPKVFMESFILIPLILISCDLSFDLDSDETCPKCSFEYRVSDSCSDISPALSVNSDEGWGEWQHKKIGLSTPDSNCFDEREEDIIYNIPDRYNTSGMGCLRYTQYRNVKLEGTFPCSTSLF